MEYIEEGMNDAGTAPSFFCKLCDCHFTDVMGKSMHAKGRRHRLAYKVQQSSLLLCFYAVGRVGVLRRRPHRRQELVTLPSVGANP